MVCRVHERRESGIRERMVISVKRYCKDGGEEGVERKSKRRSIA